MSCKTIFLSDIHMGSNVATNWFQLEVHKSSLRSILRYIEENGKAIQDVVILGDWFDFWMYGAGNNTPSLDEIMNVNRDLFLASPGQGSFAGVMDSIQGRLCYINGNHDMTLSLSKINAWFSKENTNYVVYPGYGNNLEISPRENFFYRSDTGKIYGEHGHRFDLMNKPFTGETNPYQPLPVGYFVSRSVAEYVLGELKRTEKNNAALLPGSGDPGYKNFGLDVKTIARMLEDSIEEHKIPNLAEIVLNTLTSFTANGSLNFNMNWMPGEGDPSSYDIPGYYPHLMHFGEIHTELKELTAVSSLEYFADQFLKSHKEVRVMIMGHTHEFAMTYPKDKKDQVYTNCGFNCADQPDIAAGKKNLTFVEITEDFGSDIKIQGKIVDYEKMIVKDWQKPSLINW